MRFLATALLTTTLTVSLAQTASAEKLAEQMTQADIPQSIISLLRSDFEIVNVAPISESYAVFLEKDDFFIVCQMGFKDNAFATDKCYPLVK
nr:hypothetical protein [uncultured Shinella sp.]